MVELFDITIRKAKFVPLLIIVNLMNTSQSVNCALDRYGENGTGSIHLAEYLLELAKAFQEDSEMPVWLQECGISKGRIQKITKEELVVQVLTATATVENLWGITWWCSHDIERRLDGFAELEYDLGLLTVNNDVKPVGEQFRKMIQAI